MNRFQLDDENKIETGFKTPENYFEKLPEVIDLKIKNDNKQVIVLKSNFKRLLFAVAAILLLLVAIPIVNSLQKNSNSIEDAAVENYLITHPNFAEENIVDLLDQNDLNKLKIEFNIEDKDLENELLSNPNLEINDIN